MHSGIGSTCADPWCVTSWNVHSLCGKSSMHPLPLFKVPFDWVGMDPGCITEALSSEVVHWKMKYLFYSLHQVLNYTPIARNFEVLWQIREIDYKTKWTNGGSGEKNYHLNLIKCCRKVYKSLLLWKSILQRGRSWEWSNPLWRATPYELKTTNWKQSFPVVIEDSHSDRRSPLVPDHRVDGLS